MIWQRPATAGSNDIRRSNDHGLPFGGARLMPAQPELVLIGSEAPDFTLPTPDRGPISLAEYRGREAVVLVFMRAFA